METLVWLKRTRPKNLAAAGRPLHNSTTNGDHLPHGFVGTKQIVSFLVLIAVLLFAAIYFLVKFAELHSSPVSSQQEFHNVFNFKESSASDREMSIEDDNSSILTNMSMITLHPWQHFHKSEELLLYEGGDNFNAVPCCPTEPMMTAPDGGINREGGYVALHSEGAKRQQFYEVSCRPNILNQPCRFMKRRFHNSSRCVQKYSFSYAIIVQPNEIDLYPVKQTSNHFSPLFDDHSLSSGKYMLDYIQIRSSCDCEITPNKEYKNKVANKGKKEK